jgi:Tfp pilus assembly protein PilX
MFKRKMTTINGLRKEDGVALPVTLLILVVMGALSVVAIQWSAQDVKRTERYYKTREAFYIAEAGVQQTIDLMNYDSTGNSPGAEIAAGGFDEVLDNFLSNNSAKLTNVDFASGTYNVTVADNDDNDGDTTDDDDNTLIITSLGNKGNFSVNLEAIVTRRLFKANNAITTEGDLGGNGSFTVSGTNGSIHSNSEVTISGGSATITQGATATGSCTGTGCVSGGVAPEDIPIVEPADYKSYADYILKSDGTIQEVSSGDIFTFTNPGGGNWSTSTTGDGNGLFAGLQLQSGIWKASSSTIANGMFYVEGDFSTTGSPAGWQTTIIAEGYINFGGNADVANYKDASDTVDIQNLFLVAGTDIEFSGNPSNTIQGMMAAKEQVSISGTVSLEGFLIAADVDTSESLVTGNTISGSLTVTYNGDIVAPFLSNKVKVIAWQET